MSGGDPPVTVARVFEHAVEQIVAAARELWPGKPVVLGEHVPSVTSYVHRISVGGHPLYAKYTMLGSPLVSVLRGEHGGWDELLAAQQRYVRRPDSVLAREAEQLHRFAETGQVPVCGLAGYHNGVLFTDAITRGVALDQLLLAQPRQTPTLLRRAWGPVTLVHRMRVDRWPMTAERGIEATFDRRFLAGQRGTVHFGQHLRRDVHPDMVDGLRFMVRGLRAMPATRPTPRLVFGQAEPEHIIATGSGPVYLAPGVHLASAASDLATLVSRLLLVVMSRVSATSARRHIMAGLTDLIRAERSTVGLAFSAVWMIELLTLVARDAANIISTYLTAPEKLPLPRVATAVLERAGVVMPVLEHLATGLAQHADPVEIWARVSGEAVAS